MENDFNFNYYQILLYKFRIQRAAFELIRDRSNPALRPCRKKHSHTYTVFTHLSVSFRVALWLDVHQVYMELQGADLFIFHTFCQSHKPRMHKCHMSIKMVIPGRKGTQQMCGMDRGRDSSAETARETQIKHER